MAEKHTMETLQVAAAPTPLPPPPPLPMTGGGPTLEVAHVLFMDIVGYSKLRMNEQAFAQLEMQKLVTAAPEVVQARASGRFLCRPAGDGMALLFFRDVLSPVRCALQLHDLLAKNVAAYPTLSHVKMRMGVHTGPVLMVEDVNAQSDAAGEGIILAQRVMDCGDASHILLSEAVARLIMTVDPWPRYLTDLGRCRVKHGVAVHLYNLYGRLDGAFYGNPAIPRRVREDAEARDRDRQKMRGSLFERSPALRSAFPALLAVGAVGGSAWGLWTKYPPFPAWTQSTYAKITGKTNPNSSPRKEKKTGTARKVSAVASVSARSTIAVSDLTGHSFEEAQTLAADEGLRVVKSEKSGYNTRFSEGVVYEQSPPGGQSVALGTPVYVRVSKGDPVEPEADLPKE